jgi:hypothetical protein
MAGFTLKKQTAEPGIWTPYGPEPTAEERARGIVQEAYQIRPLRPSHLDHFRKMATKKVWRRGQQEEEIDQERYNALMADHLIEAWQGVYEDDAKRQGAACNLEMKVALMAASLERANMIVQQARLYADDDEAKEAAQRANFRGVGEAEVGLPGPRLSDV